MHSTWAYQYTKYKRNQILRSVRPIFDSYSHLLLISLIGPTGPHPEGLCVSCFIFAGGWLINHLVFPRVKNGIVSHASKKTSHSGPPCCISLSSLAFSFFRMQSCLFHQEASQKYQ